MLNQRFLHWPFWQILDTHTCLMRFQVHFLGSQQFEWSHRVGQSYDYKIEFGEEIAIRHSLPRVIKVHICVQFLPPFSVILYLSVQTSVIGFFRSRGSMPLCKLVEGFWHSKLCILRVGMVPPQRKSKCRGCGYYTYINMAAALA